MRKRQDKFLPSRRCTPGGWEGGGGESVTSGIDGSSNGSLSLRDTKKVCMSAERTDTNTRSSNTRHGRCERSLRPVMDSYARESADHANDMLMLAARGINGGTPVGRTVSAGDRKDHGEAVGRVRRALRESPRRAREYPLPRLITIVMNAYGDANDEDDDKDDDDGNDTAAAVASGSMARNTRDKLPGRPRLFR